ncbi:MAG: DUF4199 domain-containing protein, partial [Bacteroidota bacterium]
MNPEYRYGFLCGAGLSAWVLIEFALGFHTTSLEIGQYSGYFSIIVPIVVIFTALREQQSRSNGFLSVKAGINTGFQIAIFSAAIFSLFLFVYNTYINPDWIISMVEWQRKKLILGGASDDEIGRFMQQNRRMNNTVGQGVMSFISSTGIGVLVTLVEILF